MTSEYDSLASYMLFIDNHMLQDENFAWENYSCQRVRYGFNITQQMFIDMIERGFGRIISKKCWHA